MTHMTQRLKQMMVLSRLPEMGPVGFKNGLMAFGSLEGLWTARASDWKRVKDLSQVDKKGLDDPKRFEAAEREIEKALRSKVEIITFFDESYPPELKEIHDPPLLLYVKGVWPVKDRLRVAVVGSRMASLYGLKMAEKVSQDLASAGLVIVSGLAKGIDTAAHKGALNAGGITWAVQGRGLAGVYPSENKKLAEKIQEKGCLISEFPMDTEPDTWHFPYRNRIISGLSRGVLIAEARLKSGALITADLALEQGRDVYALPGPADNARSQGSNALLKQGARLITGAEDILKDYSMDLKKGGRAAKRANVTDEEKKLLSHLEGLEPLHLDELIEKSHMPASKTMGLLSVLAIKGAVQELPGKYFTGK